MIPIIMNKSFERLCVVDDYKSFIWSIRYYEHGDFELCVGASQKYFQYLAVGNYIARDTDDNIGIIERIEFQLNEDNEQILIISGRFLSQILSRRIIATQTQVSGLVSSAMYQLINDAIISPSISQRKINNFINGSYVGTATIDAQYTGRSLYEVISSVCLQYGLGFKVVLNNSNKFVFQMYEGTDRSYGQSVNPYVVFSEQYENLLNAQYYKDAKTLITNVLAAGEGEGLDRKTIWVTNSNPSGLDRYEYYDDSRNISSNGGEIGQAEYMRQLAEEGRKSLTNYETKFAGSVDFNNVKFREDVNIGDIVTIEYKELNFEFNVRIIEVIESVGEDGKYNIIPTFGI